MKKAMTFVLAAALTISMAGCSSTTKETEKATEKKVTEAVTEAVTEKVTEAATEAESETEKVTEATTEAESETEEVTEATTEVESETEAVTEVGTEAESAAEEATEAGTEAESETEEVTEAETETEEATEAATEAEAETEEITEAVTEAESETEAVTEVETETETEVATEVETETEAATEVETETETEAATEVETETETEVETETETEEATEVVTEAVEEESYAAEAESETETEEVTEEVTEAAETEEETEEVTEATETEEATEEATEAAETEEATEEATEAAETEEEFVVPEGTKYKAVLLVNGTLGDKSFFDSANAGLEALQEELGEDVFEFDVEEMGGTSADMAKYEPTMYDYCDDGSYDVIICGAYQVLDALTNAANDYPDQKFIFFDEAFDFEACENDNVYNVMFKQNEVSYLVGAAAAMMTTDEDLEMVDPDNKIIGFLGGMDGSVINDFLVGYVEGAQAVEPDIEVAIAYVGDYVDSAKGKDMALTQYQNGADVGFNVAGSAGLGQIEAAADAEKYAFGVDSDQAALLPDYADHIPTSALKNVGNALINSIKRDIMGELPFGSLEYMGFAEGGVELVLDEHYEEMVPEDIREKVADLQEQIENGDIVVDSTLGDNPISTEDYDALIESVKVK